MGVNGGFSSRPIRWYGSKFGDERLAGNNYAGYVFGGIPAKGANRLFNENEDLAESVAAYIFPDVAQQWIDEKYIDFPSLHYSGYGNTPRWNYINSILVGE